MRTERYGRVCFAAVFLLLTCGRGQASSVTLVAGTASGAIGSEVVIPIVAEGARQMGALVLDLVYDAALLEAVELDEFEDEDLAAGASVEGYVVEPGRWRVALARSEPMIGTGTLLRLRFRAVSAGQSAVVLENVQAWDHSAPPLDMLVTLREGSVVVGSGLSAVWLYAAGGVAGLILLLILTKAVRGGKRESRSTQ